MESETPTKVPSRFIKIAEVTRGFADASGGGLGSIMEKVGSGSLHVRIGKWARGKEEEESWNWRDLTNFAEAI